MIVGGSRANRSEHAWRQTYRALQHGPAGKRCEKQNIQWPNEIQDLANVFVDSQEKRHSADYDPHAVFSKREVVQGIGEAESVICRFTDASVKDRRAFAVYLLFDVRK